MNSRGGADQRKASGSATEFDPKADSASALADSRGDLIFVAGVSLAAAAFLAVLTRLGPYIHFDSVYYIAAARSFIEGHGLAVPFGADRPVTLTHFPPLYPLTLALAGLITHDVIPGARWLSVGLFAANVFLFGALARKLTNRTEFSVAAASVFATSYTMLQLHAMAMTEPLFILFMMACTYFLDEYLQTGSQAALVAGALAAGLSVATRYAGIPFLCGGALIILLWNPPVRKRGLNAAIWILASAVPLVPVAIWQLGASGAITDRSLIWHQPKGRFFGRMFAGVTECFLPTWLPHRTWIMLAGCVLLAPLFAVYLHRRAGGREKYLALLLSLSVGFLIAVGFLGDWGLDVRRAMEPLFPFEILLASVAVSRLLTQRMPLTAVLIGACALMVLPNFPAIAESVRDMTRNGGGFYRREWRESATLAFIRKLPSGTILYTNLPEPVYLFTGRSARDLPHIADVLNGRSLSSAEVDSAVLAVARQAQSGNVAAVYFSEDIVRQPTMIAGDSLAARCGFTCVIHFDDGSVYLPACAKEGQGLARREFGQVALAR